MKQHFKEPIEFLWDSGNANKNFRKHRVTNQECEEVFYDHSKQILKDPLHSREEDRFILIGQTKMLRDLFIVFTHRDAMVRVISARDLNKRERNLYEEKT